MMGAATMASSYFGAPLSPPFARIMQQQILRVLLQERLLMRMFLM